MNVMQERVTSEGKKLHAWVAAQTAMQGASHPIVQPGAVQRYMVQMS